MTLPPTSPAIEDPPRHWPLVLLAVAVLITFGPLISGEFLTWDDQLNLYQNPRMNPVTWETVSHYWQHSDGYMYMPVTLTFWSAGAHFAVISSPDANGSLLNPMMFRACNILVHCGSALLVYLILRRLTRNAIAALFGALFYALHPVQVETVGWISGLKDLLWGFFSFAAIHQYLRYTSASNKSARSLHYGVGTVLLILAMLSKPTAMVTPVIVIVIDRLLLGRSWRQVVVSSGPWLALSIPCALIARSVQPATYVDGGPLWARPLMVCDSLTFYAGKILWPHHLAADYGHRPAFVLASGELAWAWILPLVLAIVAVWQLRRRPWIMAGLLVFVIGTLPTLGLTTFLFQLFSTTADHYLYVSMLGLAVIIAYALAAVRWPTKYIVTAGTVVIAALAVRSIAQTQAWLDNTAFYANTLAVNPNSLPTLMEMANKDLEAGNPAGAAQLLQRALDVEPKYMKANQLMIKALVALGRDDEAAAQARHYVDLVLRYPKNERVGLVSGYKFLANHATRKKDFDAARAWLEKALKESPGDAEAESLLYALPPASQPTTQP